MAELDTLPKFLVRNYKKWGDSKIAMRKKDFGVWQSYTWKYCYESVKYFSLGLISLGFEPGDKISVIGDNDPQWYWSEYAAQAAHGIAVGIFTDSIPSEVEYIIDHSDSKFVLAKDQEQVDKILEIKERLPKVRKIIYWDPKGLWNYEEPVLMSFNEVTKLGKKYEEAHSGLFEQMVEDGNPEDTACMCYTSGTTGLPKGAMQSHRWIVTGYEAFSRHSVFRDIDNYLTNLPPAWGTEQILGIGGHVITGTVLHFAEKADTVQDNIREIGPQTLMFSSRLWESLLRMVQVKMGDADIVKRSAYNLVLPIGYKIADLDFAKSKPNLFWKTLHVLVDIMVFRPLKDKLGLLGIRTAMTGGAALSPQAFRFFRGIGVNIKQIYGLSETAVLSTHPDGDVKCETVGRIHFPVKISDEGEILASGNCLFSGYYKDSKSTQERIENGWFHTGDAGHIDEDGHLIFYDRLQDLKVLASGYKFAPQYIEGTLKFSPYIKDAMVIGSEDKEFVSAIINMEFDNVGKWAEKRHIVFTTFVDLSQKSQVYELIGKDIARVNRTLPEPARVKKYVLLHKEFDPDEAELTRTRKLRRSFIEKRYAELIDAMYSGKSEVSTEAEIKYRDGRAGKIVTVIKIGTVD